MSAALAQEAVRRVEAGVGPLEPGWCFAWVSRCYRALYGDRYDRFGGASAKIGGLAWRAAREAGTLPTGVIVLQTGDAAKTTPGDVLFRTAGDRFGHVAIRVDGNRVAENSSTPVGRVHGAVGYRPLATVAFDTVVRFPEPETDAPVVDGVAPWAAEAMRWAVDNRIMQGDGAGQYRPEDPVTRQELAVMLHRLAQALRN